MLVQWKLDLADTDLAENLDLNDTLQKIWATIFYFRNSENLVLADKGAVTDFSAKSSFHCNMCIATRGFGPDFARRLLAA